MELFGDYFLAILLGPNLNPMTFSVVILDYTSAIREEINPLMEYPGHSVHSSSFFWVRKVAEHAVFIKREALNCLRS